jgi:nicotinamidase-related amidase
MPDAALLIMDVQNSIVERFVDSAPSLLAALGQAAAAARTSRIPVVCVRVAFRGAAPEVNGNNRIFAALADSPTFASNGPATQIHPAVEPQPGDIVVDKKRVSAFAGSDLDMVLRAQRVQTLVLSGIATSGVVLSTLRPAADLDDGLVVLRDASADADEEVHRVLFDKVFPLQADVRTVDEWVAGMGQ